MSLQAEVNADDAGSADLMSPMVSTAKIDMAKATGRVTAAVVMPRERSPLEHIANESAVAIAIAVKPIQRIVMMPSALPSPPTARKDRM